MKEVLGNPGPVKTLKDWADSWDSGIPKERAVVLIGSPGIGKTSAAQALASDKGWGYVEMNASDQRTGGAIEDIALRGAMFNTFSENGEYLRSSEGGRKLIVLDEADSLYSRQDRGAMPAIVKLITETKQPVILIVNDFYELSRKSSTIKNKTLQINFRGPQISTVARALANIAEKENVSISPEAVKIIAENASGDLRAAISDLQSVAQSGKKVTENVADMLSERDGRSSMFDFVHAVFRKNNPSHARKILNETDSDPGTALLWVDENLPYEYIDKGDLVRGYERLSRADIYLGRVHRRQHYRFWAYAGDMISFGVASAKRSNLSGGGKLRFPQYLTKMSRSKSVRTMKKEVTMKLAVYLHTSTKRVELDILPYMKLIAANNREFRISLVKNVGLDSEQLAFVLNKKIDSPVVVDAMEAATPETLKKKEIRGIEELYTEPVTIEEKPVPKEGQKSLFDF